MKKLLLALALVALMVLAGCDKTDKKIETIKTKSISAIQKQLVNAESLSVDSIKVLKDSIPYIFDMELGQVFDDFNKANEEFVRIRDSYGIRDDYSFGYVKRMTNAASKFYDMQDSLKKTARDYGYIALVNVSANNTAGAKVTSKAFVVFTDTMSLKPDGVFIVNSELSQRVWNLLNMDESINLNYNKYGMVRTDSLNPIIGFILDGQKLQ